MGLNKGQGARVEGRDKDLFDSLADEWWNPKGRLISLHKINPLRFDYFSGKIKGLKDTRVLDIGCGGGILSEEFAKKGAIVTGIDLSDKAIEVAKDHAKESGLEIEYMVSSPSQLSTHNSQLYDAVICAEILEHVDDLEGFVRDSAGLLKEGGYFFFSTVNKTLLSRVFAIYLAEYVVGIVPKGTHDFNKFIRPSTLVRLLRENSIEVEEIKGMLFDPLTFDFKLSDNTAINYLGYGVKGLTMV